MHCIIVDKLSQEGINLFESTGQFKYKENYSLQIEVYDNEIVAGVCVCGIDNVKEKHWSIRGLVVNPAYGGLNLQGAMATSAIGYAKRLGALKISFIHIHDKPQDEKYYRRYSVHFKHIANYQKDGKEYNIWQGDLTKLEWKNTDVDNMDYNNTLKYKDSWRQREKDGPFYEEGRKVKVINSQTKEKIEVQQFKKAELVQKYEAVKSKFE